MSSFDLPAELQGLLGAQSQGAAALDFRMQPTFAQGGMVGQGGMPMPPAGMMSAPPTSGVSVPPAGVRQGGSEPRMSPQQMEQQLMDFQQKNPQAIAQIQKVLAAGLQAGEISMDDLNMLERLAMTALQNPELYPYIRNFAIQRGMASEQDLPPEYDQGLIFILLLATRAAKHMQGPPPTMANGGAVTGPGTENSDSISVRVSKGEYVIPAHVVRMKGQEFFDSLLEKYKDA